MRQSSLKKYIFYAVITFAFIWMTIYVSGIGSGKSVLTMTRDSEQRELLQGKIKKLSGIVQENKKILDRLKADIAERRSLLLDKMRSEISMQSVLKTDKDYEVVEDPTHKTTTLNAQPDAQGDKNIVQAGSEEVVIPILITACNRPSVTRCLDKLFSVRDSQVEQFPVIVSQDCGDVATAKVLQALGDKITYVKHDPEPVPPNVKANIAGYYKISSHYRFAISQAFQHFPKADSIIILEDDIEISPDFLSYFVAMHELLKQDETLWCASAWNDNGKTAQVDVSEKGAETLYRTDFFPGLGWLLTRSLWENELSSKWPEAFWDDWMRQPEQRKGRSCIRPEISRTSTFGRKGVSGGQFFDSHLKYIKLNEIMVNWSSKDLSYLFKENYDKLFREKVYSLPLFRIEDLKQNKDPDARDVRIDYSMARSFKAFAKDLGLMIDFKSGVPRTAYMGIVTTLYRGRRVYLTPPENWTGYDVNWK